MNYRPVKAYIDLNALTSNLNQVRAYAPNSKILSVIKANAYGHGMIRVAEQLSKTDGFCVASIDEAITLRQKGFLHRILLLEGVFCEAEFPLVIQHRLDFVVHNQTQLDWLLRLDVSFPLNIWLKFDTGMHRLGFATNEFTQVHEKLAKLKTQPNIHYMSHFASADENIAFTKFQLAQFQTLTDTTPHPKSLCNSAAIQSFPEAHYDWVRPGIMLYGAGHESENYSHKKSASSGMKKLQAVMTLTSEITSLKWIEIGESVGYGQGWVAERKTYVGVVAIGYGDGYPRHAKTGTPVLVNGHRAPLIGRVSMDMITVDLTDIANQVSMRDTAILWGKDLAVSEIAEWSDTISYELLCGITQRVPRIEVRKNEQ